MAGKLAIVLKFGGKFADHAAETWLLLQAEGARIMKEDINSVLEGLSIRERNVLRFRCNPPPLPLIYQRILISPSAR